ncbi:MAG TPA: DUF3828 domain-containing protein [Reyranella sp.]|nr:DUF3828 domain-containing protein [Reyranella sp.]
MRRRALILLLAAPPLAAHAQTQSAQAFLESVYAPYKARSTKGQDYQKADRFFEPALARAMARDYQLAQKNGVPPTLNGDPFVDAQEWEISGLTIRAAESGEQATGIVSFISLRQKKTLAIELVKTSAGWRIADIAGASGSLRGLYRIR